MTDGIVHLVNDHWRRHFECRAAFGGYFFTGVLTLGLQDRDAHAVVARLAPAVGWVCFPNVHGQELYAVAIFLVEILQGPKLGPIGPSGKAAENQDHGFLVAELRESDLALAVLKRQGEIRRRYADARSGK